MILMHFLLSVCVCVCVGGGVALSHLRPQQCDVFWPCTVHDLVDVTLSRDQLFSGDTHSTGVSIGPGMP